MDGSKTTNMYTVFSVWDMVVDMRGEYARIEALTL